MNDKLLLFLKKEKDFDKICRKLDLKEHELYGLIAMLKEKGHNVNIFNDNGIKTIRLLDKIIIPEDNDIKINTKDKVIKLGIVSDTHMCCEYQQLTLLNEAYKDFKSRKIKTILHIGDLSDGDYRTRPDHLYSLFKIGASQQAEYIADVYPKIDGTPTYFLQGSHDDTHIKNGGADIGKMISSVRPDMVNLGHGQAFFKINGITIELLHPGGGSSYAYSYKPQKIIDSIRGGEKPQIILIGHFHKNLYMLYRNINCLLVPSLEATTPFMTANALINDLGYNVIEFRINENKEIVSFKTEYIPFYKTIKDDYKKAKVLKI